MPFTLEQTLRRFFVLGYSKKDESLHLTMIELSI
jgi:hypothetical protein